MPLVGKKRGGVTEILQVLGAAEKVGRMVVSNTAFQIVKQSRAVTSLLCPNPSGIRAAWR